MKSEGPKLEKERRGSGIIEWDDGYIFQWKWGHFGNSDGNPIFMIPRNVYESLDHNEIKSIYREVYGDEWKGGDDAIRLDHKDPSGRIGIPVISDESKARLFKEKLVEASRKVEVII